MTQKFSSAVPVNAAWKADAACLGKPTAWFFPSDEGHRSHYPEAYKLCSGCPVKAECRAYALAVPENHGFWGGLNPRQRDNLRRRQRRARTING